MFPQKYFKSPVSIFYYSQYENPSKCEGSLISKRTIVGLFFYFSERELTLNRTLRALFVQKEVFQMIILLRYMLLCYDIEFEKQELKKETCVGVQSLAL